ncbi:MAG: transporter substrate-binding domain-containing protein [Salinivirgaceae bacterium]|nr:transporter substrate-binding domain-containing protein [Salinivirgaceae bacterium]
MQKIKCNVLIYIFLLIVFAYGCKNIVNPLKKPFTDLPDIQKRGKLIALTDYNSTSYFIYRGAPMGYQYELLQNLAQHLELDLEIVVNNNLEEAFSALDNHQCDIVAVNLTVTNERQELFNFTNAIGQTRQVLIQRKPENWQIMASYNVEKALLRNQLELAGKTIHVMKNSSFVTRLKNLENEMGDSIHIVEVENYEAEQLIGLVAEGKIDYTVTDEDVALVNQTYFPNIDVYTAISFPQKQAWAINKNSPKLLAEVNNWLKTMKGSALHAVIYNKYFRNMKAKERSESDYLSLTGGKISSYDNYIKKYSKQIDWDWRLLASLIYQESRFNTKIRSWAGAFGIMQLMPQTAQRFGANKKSSVETQIKAGTKFIKWIDKQLNDEITDKEERQKFILASYNVGLGHVLDARRLAEANGKDPNIWTDNVDFFLLNKSNPKYYNSDLVKYGYCRGEETFNYVKEVVRRYEMYKGVIN